MQEESRALFWQGERAALANEPATARARFLEAGQVAVAVQLWRSAIRFYRHALELDLVDREIVDHALRIPARVLAGNSWNSYAVALGEQRWSPFGCRGASIVAGNGTYVECPVVGPVLTLAMPEADRVEVSPTTPFEGMPLTMAMIILRRALWGTVDVVPEPRTIRVTYLKREDVLLDERGDWIPLPKQRA